METGINNCHDIPAYQKEEEAIFLCEAGIATLELLWSKMQSDVSLSPVLTGVSANIGTVKDRLNSLLADFEAGRLSWKSNEQ